MVLGGARISIMTKQQQIPATQHNPKKKRNQQHEQQYGRCTTEGNSPCTPIRYFADSHSVSTVRIWSHQLPVQNLSAPHSHPPPCCTIFHPQPRHHRKTERVAAQVLLPETRRMQGEGGLQIPQWTAHGWTVAPAAGHETWPATTPRRHELRIDEIGSGS